MADRNIVVQHADGRRFAVPLGDYRSKPIDEAGHTYQQLGFRIVSWEGGEPYRPPSERAEPEETPKRGERPARTTAKE